MLVATYFETTVADICQLPDIYRRTKDDNSEFGMTVDCSASAPEAMALCMALYKCIIIIINAEILLMRRNSAVLVYNAVIL